MIDSTKIIETKYNLKKKKKTCVRIHSTFSTLRFTEHNIACECITIIKRKINYVAREKRKTKEKKKRTRLSIKIAKNYYVLYAEECAFRRNDLLISTPVFMVYFSLLLSLRNKKKKHPPACTHCAFINLSLACV